MEELKKLIAELNEASKKYYNSDSPIMSDREYDEKYNLLQSLENKYNIIYSNSPTQNVGAKVLSKLNKINLENRPMLSLEKIYTQEEILNFEPKENKIAMIKCDGLSTRIIYKDGILFSANTRGNGYIGVDITEHIKLFKNVPLTINKKGTYIVDGESIIKKDDFDSINKDNQFSNPRNTAAGTLNSLDTSVVKDRKLSFIVWDIIEGSDFDFLDQRLEEANTLGFEIVDYFYITSPITNIDFINSEIISLAKDHYIPCDGVVWRLNNISKGLSLGKTAHHYNYAKAWKPQMEDYETHLKTIEWTMGRTGKLTPVAIFEPIEIEGTIVERASVHNLDILEELLGTPYEGQTLKIFKANYIIPQIRSGEKKNCEETLKCVKCPICGGPVEELCISESRDLYCTNPNCEGKLINKLDHFCGKKGLDIKGLSKKNLEKLITWGWINNFEDIFNLYNYYDEWIEKSGFGEKSVNNILESIEKSKTCTLDKFIASIGIPLIGNSASKILCDYIDSYEDFRIKVDDKFNFAIIDGFSFSKVNNILTFDYTNADNVAKYLNIIKEENKKDNFIQNDSLAGINIVITGKLNNYKNRTELQSIIEALGGKVQSSVNKATNYLINNDINSNSSKNKKAKDLSIEIISEQDFIDKFLI